MIVAYSMFPSEAPLSTNIEQTSTTCFHKTDLVARLSEIMANLDHRILPLQNLMLFVLIHASKEIKIAIAPASVEEKVPVQTTMNILFWLHMLVVNLPSVEIQLCMTSIQIVAS
jgi:hypothetical protein